MPARFSPDALVSTAWVAEHLDDPAGVRVIEVSGDPLLYETGHLSNAVKLDAERDLQDDVRRALVGRAPFARICARHGIANDTVCVFYGDEDNRWACFAFWIFKLYGHEPCLLMDGGRKKWRVEGRPLVQERPTFAPTRYQAGTSDRRLRVFRDEVLQHVEAERPLIDVRSPEEYTGMLIDHPTSLQEGVLRGGHIPGAQCIPWRQAMHSDGTFQTRMRLEAYYLTERGLDPEAETVVYCRLGDRSSHTWFVLTYLLGFTHVKNYDGSWSEWGNLVEVPIVRGPDPVASIEGASS